MREAEVTLTFRVPVESEGNGWVKEVAEKAQALMPKDAKSYQATLADD